MIKIVAKREGRGGEELIYGEGGEENGEGTVIERWTMIFPRALEGKGEKLWKWDRE